MTHYNIKIISEDYPVGNEAGPMRARMDNKEIQPINKQDQKEGNRIRPATVMSIKLINIFEK